MKLINYKCYFIFLSYFFCVVQLCFCKSSQEQNLKYRVDNIKIIGNKWHADNAIKKVMLTKESGLFSKPVFYEDLFKDDLHSITKLYRNSGFLDVEVNSNISDFDTTNNRLNIKINITEYEQTLIDTIIFNGNIIFSNEYLKNKLLLKQGEPFNESLIEKDNYTLLSNYANKGYIDAIIKPELRRDHQSNRISIIFNISEGIQSHIKTIEMTGLEQTKKEVVERELLLKPSMVCDYQKMLESQHRLYQTGIFRIVSIKPVMTDTIKPEIRDIHVNVTEKETGEINFGVGFGSYEKLRGSFELFQNNFQGMNNQIGSQLRISFKQQKLESSYTNPWLFNTRTKYDLNTYIEHTIEPNYELKGWGGKSTVGKEISDNSKFAVAYKYEDIFFSNIKDTTELRKKNKNRGNTRSLQFIFTRDSRNSQFNTTKGSFVQLNCESAGGFLKGTNTFVKVTNEERFFFNFKYLPSTILGIRLFTGWMNNFGKSNTIPLNERFYAGGSGSIRGFGRREVGPKSENNVPVGGKISLIMNYELRYPIYKKFGGTIFWDIGNIWSNHQQINLLSVRNGIGCGLRYNSPLGIIRIDAGLNINRKNNEQFGEIYFTIGQIF